MIADYRTALQLIWISSALNLIVPGAEVSGMSIGVILVLARSLSLWLSFTSLFLSLSLFAIYSLSHTHTHTHTRTQYRMRTHEHKHIQSSLSLLQTNTNTSRSASFSPTRSRKHPDSGGCLWYRADTGPWKMHVPFACFIRNTHRDSIPISAEKPHRNINYAGNLGGSVGRNAAEGEYGIQSVILMRGSVSLWSSGGPTLLAQIIKYTLAWMW